jgi:hypothetical protein
LLLCLSLGDRIIAGGPQRIDSELDISVRSAGDRIKERAEVTGYVGVTAKWSGLPTAKNTDIAVTVGSKGKWDKWDWDAKWTARPNRNGINRTAESIFWDSIRWFTKADFMAKTKGPYYGKDVIDRKLVRLLDHIRTTIGKPMNINSGTRNPGHNKKVGGVLNSAHIPKNGTSYAADVRCVDSRTRFQILHLSNQCGIKRIGVAKSFIHLDTSPYLPNRVVWLYK